MRRLAALHFFLSVHNAMDGAISALTVRVNAQDVTQKQADVCYEVISRSISQGDLNFFFDTGGTSSWDNLLKSAHAAKRPLILGDSHPDAPLVLMATNVTTLPDLLSGLPRGRRAALVVFPSSSMIDTLAMKTIVILRNFSVFQPAVIVLNSGGIGARAFSWDPLHAANSCGRFVRHLRSSDATRQGFTLPWSFLKEMPRCPLRAATAVLTPYVLPFLANTSDDNVLYSGGDLVEAARLIAQRTGMHLRFVRAPSGSSLASDPFGARQELLASGAVDFFFPERWRTELMTKFDVTAPILNERYAFFTPLPQPWPHWRSLVRAFSPSVWWLTLSGLLAFAAVHTALATTGRGERRGLRRGAGLLVTLGAMLGQAPTAPRSARCRLAMLLWLIHNMQVNAGYQSAVFALLLRPGLQPPPMTAEELLDSPLQLAGHRLVLGLVRGRGTLPYTLAGNRATVCRDVDACLQRAATAGDMAVLSGANTLQYKLPRFLSRRGVPLLRQLPEVAMTLPLGFYLRHGDPLLQRFSEVIQRSQSAGLPNKWRADLVFAAQLIGLREEQGTAEADDGEPQALTVDHVQGALLAWALGISAAGVSFAFESCLGCRSRSVKEKRSYHRSVLCIRAR